MFSGLQAGEPDCRERCGRGTFATVASLMIPNVSDAIGYGHDGLLLRGSCDRLYRTPPTTSTIVTSMRYAHVLTLARTVNTPHRPVPGATVIRDGRRCEGLCTESSERPASLRPRLRKWTLLGGQETRASMSRASVRQSGSIFQSSASAVGGGALSLAGLCRATARRGCVLGDEYTVRIVHPHEQHLVGIAGPRVAQLGPGAASTQRLRGYNSGCRPPSLDASCSHFGTR